MLSERQKRILSAIVDDYIRSAEPVGSRTISKRSDIGFSPATIRNEMSDLEELGYLEQPHTSAGRIPSEKGYRYYVDHLVDMSSYHHVGVDLSQFLFAESIQEMGQVMQQVVQILSQLTNYTAVALGSEAWTDKLRHIQILPLSDHRVVAIIVTDSGHVENRTVDVPKHIPLDDIERVVQLLNYKLIGVPVHQLRHKLHSEVALEMRRYIDRCELAIELVDHVLASGEDNDEGSLFLSGMTNMLIQPEFRDLDKLKNVLDLLDESHTLRRILTNLPSGVVVRIGAENGVDAMAECSIVSATVQFGQQPLGVIGVLGPTRMDYPKVLALLRSLSQDLPRWAAKRFFVSE